MTTDRPITGHANYPGDHRHLANQIAPMGPTTCGELMWPVTADYDEAADRTRVAFTHMPHPEAATR